MGSVAASRRTQSAYPTFLASTNPADLTFSTYGTGPQSPGNTYSATLTQEIARLPQVRRAESWVGLFAAPLKANGAPDLDVTRQLNLAGSVNGLYFNEDRATAIEGRMARPDRPDEFVTTVLGAHLLGLHVGQTVAMGFYGSTQGAMPGFGTALIPPERRVDMKLVGLVAFNNEVVEDDTDRLPTNVLFTPALTRSLLDSGSTQGTWYGLQLVGGNRSVPAVEQEIDRLLPAGNAAFFRVTSFGEAKVESAVKPEAIAFGVFGAIAAVAAVLIALLSISRQLREGDEDRLVLRALGAGRITAAFDGLPGILAAVLVGSLLACGVAVGLSPLSPLRPGAPGLPVEGVRHRLEVLALGLLVLVGGLGTSAVSTRIPRGTPSGHPSLGARGGSTERGAANRLVGAARVGSDRDPLRPGAGKRPHGRTGAFCFVRWCPGGDDRDGHGHLWQQSPQLGVATGAVRMELELRPQLDQRHTAPGPSRSRPRPGRCGVDRGADP